MPAAELKKSSVRKSEETRLRILEAALAIFRERSFERATMRDIASAAEMAVGAAYYYFPSKEAIALAFYEHSQEVMSCKTVQALEESHSLQDRLCSIINCKFEQRFSLRKH